MFDDLALLRMSTSLVAHSGARQAVIAQNVANADTPGYRARDIAPFAAELSSGPEMRATRTGHIRDDAHGAARWPGVAVDDPADPNGNSVSLETEMFRAVEVQRRHDMAVTIYRNGLDVLRSAVGRR